jgi:homoserine kinase type II
MAVYTEVTPDEAAALLRRLGLGALRALTPIQGGIENTNYFVDADAGRFVLTLFERLTAAELPFYLQLMRHLARRGLPVPEPRGDDRGEILHRVAGRPAALVDRLSGTHPLAPDALHCAALGQALARMHLAVGDFPLAQPHPRGLAWWIETVPVLLPHLAPAPARLLREELAHARQVGESPAHATLPRGAIHADLFRDNTMFEGHRLTGIFDFYFAGVDSFLFDLAVCLNDWCIDLDSGRHAEDRAQALVAAYAAVRPLEPVEVRLLPALLRAAALRFWISRLWDLHLPRDARVLKAHDPGHFERVLRARIADPWHPTNAAAR